MRKYYIDNLRLICIFLLFPFHTFMAYNGLYLWNPIFVESNDIASGFILVFGQWFMPLLFVFAGMSVAYSLQKRTAKEFLVERCSKILIPFVAGMLTVVPVMFAIGIVWTYPGTAFPDALAAFFTQSMSPMHLWFLMYLFIVSVAALPIVLRFMKTPWFSKPREFSIWLLIAFGLLLWLSSYVLEVVPGKSIVMFFLLFMAGALIMYADWVQERLEKYRWPLFIAFIIMLAIFVYKGMYGFSTGHMFWIFDEWRGPLFDNMFMWIAILAVTGMGKRYLEFTDDRLKYFYAASFPIYIFHYIWIIALQCLITGVTSSAAVQVVFTIALSVPLTIGTYEVLRRWSVTRFLFGMSKSKPKKTGDKARRRCRQND